MGREVISVELTSSMKSFINGLVDTGRYQNKSEVMREALRLLHDKEATSDLTQLKQMIADGLASGKGQYNDFDTFVEAMKKKHG
ncbi:MAG: type II toxin-antitoxin system ParD family antitoxin [Pseudomonadota bacterium]